jgi:hypothetical protein
VLAGEISAYGGMIEAGWRTRPVGRCGELPERQSSPIADLWLDAINSLQYQYISLRFRRITTP